MLIKEEEVREEEEGLLVISSSNEGRVSCGACTRVTPVLWRINDP